ncbi:hypothetical protein TYRP_013994 [Tyrophagus putrescentiae]|nr:hypothetical protein TYRP_002035 [Tyrophagus putrescentiae]KAH9405700.1 hypothetical protein TYRP_013994 [Tyrophagus putrescentiae]
MKSFSILLIACLAGLVFADQATDTANQFVDQFITALKAKNNFDPMTMGEHIVTVKERIGFLDVKIKIDLHKTVLTGLARASRVGDAKVTNKDGSFNAKLQLGDSNVKANSDMTLMVSQLIHPDLKLEADIGHMTITFGTAIGTDGKPDVNEFNIDELTDTKVHIHGQISLFDPLIDVVATEFIKYFNTVARDVLTQVIKPLLQDEMKKMMGGGSF